MCILQGVQGAVCIIQGVQIVLFKVYLRLVYKEGLYVFVFVRFCFMYRKGSVYYTLGQPGKFGVNKEQFNIQSNST